MPAIFIMLEILINKWCTFPMPLEEILIPMLSSVGGSFAGAALFWKITCPNKGCCQMKAVHRAVERTPELK